MRECRTMIQHYFKIAFRNILKYKTQSIYVILEDFYNHFISKQF